MNNPGTVFLMLCTACWCFTRAVGVVAPPIGAWLNRRAAERLIDLTMAVQRACETHCLIERRYFCRCPTCVAGTSGPAVSTWVRCDDPEVNRRGWYATLISDVRKLSPEERRRRMRRC